MEDMGNDSEVRAESWRLRPSSRSREAQCEVAGWWIRGSRGRFYRVRNHRGAALASHKGNHRAVHRGSWKVARRELCRRRAVFRKLPWWGEAGGQFSLE